MNRLRLTPEHFPMEKELEKAISYVLIQNTAWWNTHSSGRPVKAPKDASRLEYSEHRGCFLEWGKGGNTLLIGLALKQIVRALWTMDLSELSISELKSTVAYALRSYVCDYSGRRYEPYPASSIYPGHIEFGSHSIDIDRCAEILIDIAGAGEKLGYRTEYQVL